MWVLRTEFGFLRLVKYVLYWAIFPIHYILQILLIRSFCLRFPLEPLPEVWRFHWMADSGRLLRLSWENPSLQLWRNCTVASYSVLNQPKADTDDWLLGRYPQFKQNITDEYGLMLEWFNPWELCSHYKGFCFLLGHISTGIYTRSLLGRIPPENQ